MSLRPAWATQQDHVSKTQKVCDVQMVCVATPFRLPPPPECTTHGIHTRAELSCPSATCLDHRQGCRMCSVTPHCSLPKSFVLSRGQHVTQGQQPPHPCCTD